MDTFTGGSLGDTSAVTSVSSLLTHAESSDCDPELQRQELPDYGSQSQHKCLLGHPLHVTGFMRSSGMKSSARGAHTPHLYSQQVALLEFPCSSGD